RPRREPARGHDVRGRARRGTSAAPTPAHGLLRELARRRPCGRGQSLARFPLDQQELRALLRLRRSLMLTLLRDLRRLRRQLDLDSELAGPVEAILPVDLRIPGCPPPPEAIAAGLVELLDVAGSEGGGPDQLRV